MRGSVARRSVACMADPPIAGVRRAYLIEHYLLGAGLEELTRSARHLRDIVAQMEREGRQIAYLSATVVPADDYFASMLEAPTEDVAREALARGGIPFERISPAVWVTRSDDGERAPLSIGEDPQNHQGAESS